MNYRKKVTLLLLCLSLLSGCFSAEPRADIAYIYNRAAMSEESGRNPVIVIPGILGSRLVDTIEGDAIWGSFRGTFADPATAEGLRKVAMPLLIGDDINDVTTNAEAVGVLGRIEVSLLSLPIELNAYYNILKTLGIGGFRDEELGKAETVDYGEDHFTCFQFPYDWRRDITYNAARLDDFIKEKKRYVEAEHKKRFGKHHDVKFTLVAHSMGSLLARYYLRYGGHTLQHDQVDPRLSWAGTENVSKTILIGPPNGGSIVSFWDSIHGKNFSLITPNYPAALLASFPSIYQLLPRPRFGAYYLGSNTDKIVDIYDAKVWEQYGWGLVDPEQDVVLQKLLPGVDSKEERKQIVFGYLQKALARSKRVHNLLDSPATLPDNFKMNVFIGDALQTPSAVTIKDDGEIALANHVPGDGLVPRSSALLDKRLAGEWSPRLQTDLSWSNVTFLNAEHLELTESPTFSNNVLYQLLESP